MKIAISNRCSECKLRIRFLIKTLIKDGHEIIYHDNLTTVPNSHLWVFDYHGESVNKYEKLFTQYDGKLIFQMIDDRGDESINDVSSFITKRIDGWITCVSIDPNKILLPRFLVDVRNVPINFKLDQIVFFGSTTGRLDFNGKNWRVETIRRLKEHSFLKNFFIGGVVRNDIVKYPNIETDYTKSFSHLVTPWNNNWLDLLDASQICLALHGNVRWTFRHLEAMRSKCTVISFKVKGIPDPGNWLFRDYLKDEFYWLEDDLSNLESLCEYAILHEKESKEKAENGYNFYKKYFEVMPDGCYNSLQRELIYEQFLNKTKIKL